MTLPPGARDARAIAGGDINEAFRVTLADGRAAFVKTRADAAPGEYAAEAAGLQWLADAGALPTPRVLDVDDGYLALEWVPQGRLSAVGAEQLGRGLAAVHAAGAVGFGRFAASEVGWLGPLRVSNEPCDTWAEFYAERRIAPLARLAHERGALDRGALRALDRVCARIAQLAGPAEPPARLHGDLWSGNVLADADGRPWLIDASAYGGHREVDLAMLGLFSAPPGALESYRELAPLAEGWQERVGLYELLPLLVHALLFGGSYREAVARTARRYA